MGGSGGGKTPDARSPAISSSSSADATRASPRGHFREKRERGLPKPIETSLSPHPLPRSAKRSERPSSPLRGRVLCINCSSECPLWVRRWIRIERRRCALSVWRVLKLYSPLLTLPIDQRGLRIPRRKGSLVGGDGRHRISAAEAFLPGPQTSPRPFQEVCARPPPPPRGEPSFPEMGRVSGPGREQQERLHQGGSAAASGGGTGGRRRKEWWHGSLQRRRRRWRWGTGDGE